VLSIAVGIGKYNGGGMMQVPSALPADGKFDITVIKKLSMLKIVKNVKNLYDGSFVRLREVEVLRANEVRIESGKKLWLETDGEVLGHAPFSFSILPAALQVIVPPTFNIN
jgi:diacylglycerol kinase family enzyme